MDCGMGNMQGIRDVGCGDGCGEIGTGKMKVLQMGENNIENE